MALRPRTSLVRSQYDSYVRNTTTMYLVFGTMTLRLISGRDGFSKCLSRFKILRGHLDQTSPYSSYNVRKQISIGCYYDHYVFTPFKPVRFELLGRTEDEYKCNRGITLSRVRSYPFVLRSRNFIKRVEVGLKRAYLGKRWLEYDCN